MNSEDSRTLILASVLSVLVLIGWNYFYAPKLQQERLNATPAAQSQAASSGHGPASVNGASAPQVEAASDTGPKTRAEALALSPRVTIDTPALSGSIALKGGLIDDLELKAYRETIDPKSSNITLFSPPGGPAPYWAESGFVPDAKSVKTSNQFTVWSADATSLGVDKPVTRTWGHGAGRTFRRIIAVDEHYMFTITDSVDNAGGESVSLRPYSRILRRGKPEVAGYSVLHEGPLGVIGDGGVQEITYAGIEKEAGKDRKLDGDGGWLGFTDKYWAAAIIPRPAAP